MIHDIMRKPNSIIVLLYIFHIIHPQKQKRSIRLLFRVEDTVHTKQKNATKQTYCLHCFPRSFVLLSSIVVRQLCLLHEVRALLTEANYYKQHQGLSFTLLVNQNS